MYRLFIGYVRACELLLSRKETPKSDTIDIPKAIYREEGVSDDLFYRILIHLALFDQRSSPALAPNAAIAQLV